MEHWQIIPRTDGCYEASDLGRIRNASSKRILTGTSDAFGYTRVHINYDGKDCKRYVHVLVWEAFVGDKLPNTCLNHKDENPANNALSNLENVSYSYNRTYGQAEVKRRRTNAERTPQEIERNRRQNEWLKKRLQDPEYRKKRNAAHNARRREKYANDPAYRERERMNNRRLRNNKSK